MKKAANGNTVKVHYTGRLEDGTVFDSSEGRDPLMFTIGGKQLIPGFEAGVIGMKEGEKKTINIPSEDAYGLYRDDMIIDFPREQVPADIELEIGGRLSLKDENNQIIPVVIKAISDDTVMLDANHELAGKDLIFDIEVVEVE